MLTIDEPWFVAKDVAVALGYANTTGAIQKHCKYAKPFRVSETLTLEIQPQTVIIPEKDIYRLIMRSNLPAAEKFQDWVMDEVLPYPEAWPLYATFIAAEAIDGHKRNSVVFSIA